MLHAQDKADQRFCPTKLERAGANWQADVQRWPSAGESADVRGKAGRQDEDHGDVPPERNGYRFLKIGRQSK